MGVTLTYQYHELNSMGVLLTKGMYGLIKERLRLDHPLRIEDKDIVDLCRKSDMSLVGYVFEKRRTRFFYKECINAAASAGNLDVVKFLIDHGTPFSYEAIHHAVTKNQFEVLKFLTANRTERCNSDILGTVSYSNVVSNEMIVYLLETFPNHIKIDGAVVDSLYYRRCFKIVKHMYTIDEDTDEYRVEFKRKTFNTYLDDAKAERITLDDFDIVNFIMTTFLGKTETFNRHLVAKPDQYWPEFIRMLAFYGLEKHTRHYLVNLAIQANDMDLFISLYDIETVSKANIITLSAYTHRNLGFIKHLIGLGLPVLPTADKNILETSTKPEHDDQCLELLQYLYKEHPLIFNNVHDCILLATSGNLYKTTKFLVEKYAIQNPEADLSAALGRACTAGNMDLVRFLHTRVPVQFAGSTNIEHASNRLGSLPIIQFLHTNRSENCTDDALHNAINLGDMPMFTFLLNNCTDVLEFRSIRLAISSKRVEMAKVLYSNLPTIPFQIVFDAAIEWGNLEFIKHIFESDTARVLPDLVLSAQRIHSLKTLEYLVGKDVKVSKFSNFENYAIANYILDYKLAKVDKEWFRTTHTQVRLLEKCFKHSDKSTHERAFTTILDSSLDNGRLDIIQYLFSEPTLAEYIPDTSLLGRCIEVHQLVEFMAKRYPTQKVAVTSIDSYEVASVLFGLKMVTDVTKKELEQLFVHRRLDTLRYLKDHNMISIHEPLTFLKKKQFQNNFDLLFFIQSLTPADNGGPKAKKARSKK
eukprot:gene14615-17287_t